MNTKNTSTQKVEDPDSKTMEIMERLIAMAPTDKSDRASQQVRSPRITYIQRHPQKKFFPPGHNGRGSKD